MSFEPETKGWTKEEASRRVPNYLHHLKSGNLTAWGRSASADSKFVRLPPKGWSTEKLSRAGKPEKADAFWMEKPVFDLSIFPVLLAPNAAEAIGCVPLAELFSRFVLGDPEVQLLAEAAIRVSPPLAYYYGQAGTMQEVIWPLVTDDLNGIGDCVINQYVHRDHRWTVETQKARDALLLRYDAMIQLLRLRHLTARGDPVRSNDPREILCTIWGARNYYLHLRTGDILQDRIWPDEETEVSPLPDGLHMYDIRWRAVLLEPRNSENDRPAAPLPSADKPSDQVVSLAPAETGCTDWLEKLMADPSIAPIAKSELWEQAKEKWPGILSYRGFGRCWGFALHRLDRNAHSARWTHAGRRTKSPQI